jgi:hypothetical protein
MTCRLTPHMKLHLVGTANRRISNKKFRMMKCGIAALSLFSKIKMIEYLTSTLVRRRRVRYSLFDIRYSLFQSAFLDQTDRSVTGADT